MLFSAFNVVVAPEIAYIASSVVVPRYMAHPIGGVVQYGGRHYVRDGVFVVRFVVDDDEDNTNSIMLATNMVFCRIEFLHSRDQPRVLSIA